jgi:hypothetical protein
MTMGTMNVGDKAVRNSPKGSSLPNEVVTVLAFDAESGMFHIAAEPDEGEPATSSTAGSSRRNSLA